MALFDSPSAAGVKANAIKLFGAKEMEAAFARLETNVQRAIFRRVMRGILRKIVATARSLVPVLTGRLKRSLKVRALKRSRTRFGVQIFTDAPYAFAVETGRRVSKRGSRALTERGRLRAEAKGIAEGHANVMIARPYLRPAWDLHRPEMEAEIEAGFDEGIRDAWEKEKETAT